MSSSLLCSRRNNKKDGHEEQMQIISRSRSKSSTAAVAPSPAATMRKGPWTDEEDEQLVRFVRLFGERRWDFLAKVSGLRRTGKSCRLRWVNYLHPGLRRGRITADEERLIVELHAQWGSRWSRIARSLPGRTDNEIKNFWRTRTRKHKKALEETTAAAAATADSSSPSPSSSSVSAATSSECPGSPSPNSGVAATPSSSGSSSSSPRGGTGSSADVDAELEEESSATAAAASKHHDEKQQQQHLLQPQEYYTMDQLWNDIAAADAAAMSFAVDACWGGSAGAGHCYGGSAAAAEPPSSPVWEYFSDYSLWRIDDEEYYKKMLDSS